MPTPCQTLLTELPFYEVAGSLAPGCPATIPLYCPAPVPSRVGPRAAPAWRCGRVGVRGSLLAASLSGCYQIVWRSLQGRGWVWRLAGGWHADTAEPRWRGPRLAPHPRVILLGPGWGGGKADPPGHTLGPQRELGNMRGPRYSGRSCYRRLLWSWS